MPLTAIILGVLVVMLYLERNWWRTLCHNQQEAIDAYERLTKQQDEALKLYHRDRRAKPVKVLKCKGSPDIIVEHAESCMYVEFETGSFN